MTDGRCDYCGDPLLLRNPIPPSGHRFCGKPCRKNASIVRKRAREAGVEIVDGPRWKVFEDADWVCHLCGGKILRQDSQGDVAESIDHIVPLELGGAHAPWNWAAGGD